LDDDLEAADRLTIEGHLRDCPCCEEVLDSLRHTVAACHEQLPPLPPDVRERASARVKELLSRRRPRP
jgi:anti-sigma factor RsiW